MRMLDVFNLTDPAAPGIGRSSNLAWLCLWILLATPVLMAQPATNPGNSRSSQPDSLSLPRSAAIDPGRVTATRTTNGMSVHVDGMIGAQLRWEQATQLERPDWSQVLQVLQTAKPQLVDGLSSCDEERRFYRATASVPLYSEKMDLPWYRGLDGIDRRVLNASEWATRRFHTLGAMQVVMGALPNRDDSNPSLIEVISEVSTAAWRRLKIAFVVEPGDSVPAYLFLPRNTGGKLPGVLCLHQTIAMGKDEPAGLGGSTNLHYALELAERGFVTLVPDYPNFGDYRYDPYAHGYASATMKAIRNHQRALDVLASLPEVDASRLGCIGHSLGGHNTLFLAAFDARVKAAVTSCGFCSFFKYQGGDLTGWSGPAYMPRIATEYGANPSRMPFDFTELLASIAPRAVFVNAPTGDSNFPMNGVVDCELAARPIYQLHDADDNLVVEHPVAGHDFPIEVRERAYSFLEQTLQ